MFSRRVTGNSGSGKRVALRCPLSAITAAWILALLLSAVARADDYSPPAILQWFETSWNTMQARTPDVFMAGYGAVQTPPPYRADSGNQSVGYDIYDRFDLGSPDDPTLYTAHRRDFKPRSPNSIRRASTPMPTWSGTRTGSRNGRTMAFKLRAPIRASSFPAQATQPIRPAEFGATSTTRRGAAISTSSWPA